jgi:membrane protease YdiL (CAAX protease family)
MRVVVKQIPKLVGPIALSALSVFISFLILQPLALWLDPTFNLLASRGIGKVAFVSLIIYQIFLLLVLLPQKFFEKFLELNIYFFTQKGWLKRFFTYFAVFFSFHALLLFIFFMSNFVQYNPNWGTLSITLIYRILFGFFVVFMLAWTEELIFRGTIFLYFVQHLNPLPSLLLASTIFMFAHDLSNPLNLITKDWQLGLGLFLLGAMLNSICMTTKKLYTGMGAHAGIVFVKVILRRMPLLTFLPAAQLPFWVTRDLRTSPLVHILFFIVILGILLKNRTNFTKNGVFFMVKY